MVEVLAIEGNRAVVRPQRRPSASSQSRAANLRRVRVEDPDVDRASSPAATRRTASSPAGSSISIATRSRWAIGSPPPTLKTSPLQASGAGAQERVGSIVDVDEVADLRAVAVNLDLAALDRQPDEPADKTLAIVANELAGTVDVGQPQRTRTDAEDVVVDEVVVLAGRLVDAVDVRRPDQMDSSTGSDRAGRRPAACRRRRPSRLGCTCGTLRASGAAPDS